MPDSANPARPPEVSGPSIPVAERYIKSTSFHCNINNHKQTLPLLATFNTATTTTDIPNYRFSTTMASNLQHDVIIAGAGPIGLFLACELAMREISVLILERNSNPADPWYALSISPQTQTSTNNIQETPPFRPPRPQHTLVRTLLPPQLARQSLRHRQRWQTQRLSRTSRESRAETWLQVRRPFRWDPAGCWQDGHAPVAVSHPWAGDESAADESGAH